MRNLRLFSIAATVLVVVGLVGSAQAQEPPAGVPDDGVIIVHPTNPHGADRANRRLPDDVSPMAIEGSLTTGGTGVASPKITYHGGSLIQTPVIYLIWYGNWNQSNGSDNPAGQQIVRDFANHIGGSPYFNLNTTYSINGFNITGNVTFGGEATDTGSHGTRLSDSSILQIVSGAINNHSLPYDPNGVYFVLTSSNVSERSGFCTQYCGWHTAGNATAGHVRYSFVGNANRCLNACAAQTTGPNGNAGVDAMISVIAHELEESTTDPDPISGWIDSQNGENGDKCAWTFGHSQFQVSNGAWANVTLGTRNFLIQRNLEQISTGDLCMMDSTHN